MTGFAGHGGDRREPLYEQVANTYGGLLARLAAGYEADPALREDLEQEIHLQLWRSLERFRGQCRLATWIYRVAHNVGAGHIDKALRRRRTMSLVALGDAELCDQRAGPEERTDATLALERLYGLIHKLRPLDRQVVLLYLEDLDAAAIAEVTGLTAGAVAPRVHRIKTVLKKAFAPEATHDPVA